MSTSSSSTIFPSAPQEHAVQSVYQEQLREHSVDEQRYPQPFCYENLLRGGNPRTTTPTGHEPKQLETKIIETEAYCRDPYQLYEIQGRSGEEDHQAPITEEVEEFGKTDLQSYTQSQIHFDDSAESTADSDLADGGLRKMLTSPLYAQKATEKPDAMVMQEREVSAQRTQADRRESLRSHSSEGSRASEKPAALFPSERRNQIWSSVLRNANPSNIGSLFLKVTRITSSIRRDQT